MKENLNNKVHLHGYMNNVKSINVGNGKKSFIIDLATIENYKDNAGEFQKKYTYHTVNVVSDDKDVIARMEKIAADLQNNRENRGVEGFKPEIHEASFDGTLITRRNESNGVNYYNQVVLSSPEDMKLDCRQAEGEVRNTAEFKGNIAKIDLKDDFAVIQIATHYFAPGKAENFKGEVKPYHEETSYVETRLSGSFRKKEFEALKNGDIAVGDLVTVRGQMHNNNYQDKDGVNRYKIVVDLNKVDVVAKKGEKKAEAEDQEQKAAETKKEAPEKAPKAKKATSRKKQVTM